MKSPITYRRGIPLFHDKTEIEYQKDIYEHYDNMVTRQSALHLTDELWGEYPMQPILDFAAQHHGGKLENILEVGCGVGRWVSTLAKQFADAECWGIDYSYQMLRRANEYWVKGESIELDMSDKGFSESLHLKGHQLTNLNFGLAKAELLPFEDNSQDLVVSSFLLDRMEQPIEGLTELFRVLRPGGKFILVSPLNFKKAEHWEMLYPSEKIRKLVAKIGFEILEWKEDLPINEPLDSRGNKLHWKCIRFSATK